MTDLKIKEEPSSLTTPIDEKGNRGQDNLVLPPGTSVRSSQETLHSPYPSSKSEKPLDLQLSLTPPLGAKIPLTERDAPEVLGFAYPQSKKWLILSVIFIVQCSMNFNASIYANGVGFLQEKFDISAQKARVGQMVFLVCYAFGCELWAPWSEELGRWGVLQASLALVNRQFKVMRNQTDD
jgi:hypothetical protein